MSGNCTKLRKMIWTLKIKYPRQNEIIMEDGTRYIVFSNLIQTKGFSIDQIILTDDKQWSVLLKQSEIESLTKDRLNLGLVCLKKFKFKNMKLN